MKPVCIQCGEARDYINCREIDCPQAFWNNENKEIKNMNVVKNSFDDFDFGFSAVTEDELKQHEKQQIESLAKHAESTAVEALTYKERLESMYKMVMPLITNLSKDPQKEYILWPNREKKLMEFKAKLDALMNG
jgi:hypothetical protein